MKASNYPSLLLLLLAGPLWADSTYGKITVTEKPGRVVNSGTLNMKTGKTSKITRTVKHDTEVKVLRPRDVVVAYNRADGYLQVELTERTLTVDEKKYTAVSAIPHSGHAYISTIQKVACLKVPVREHNGKFTAQGDAKFGVYGGRWDMPVPQSGLRLSGSLQRGVQVHASGHESGKTSDVRWDFTAQGKVYDPTERAPKSFPPLTLGNREVEVQADWDTDGSPYVSLPISREGKKAREAGGQQIHGAKEIKRLISALDRRSAFSWRGFRLENQSGTYTFSQDEREVVLSPKDSARLVGDVRAAAKYLGIR